MKTKIQIKSWAGTLLYEHEAEDNTLKKTLQDADLQGADLRGADLLGADLRGADLRGAVLQDADLQDADLQDADLQGADLRGADLRDAVLRGAVLRGAVLRGAVLLGADLRDAVLRGADLRGAVLRGAVLRGAVLRDAVLQDADLQDADLQGADLRGADLRGAKNLPEEYFRLCRDDLWAVLSSAPKEVSGLRQALIDGKVDGSTYEGDCACLVGTIANVKGCNYQKLDILKPDSSRPIERFFTAIRPGDTPEKNDFSKLSVEWIDQWLENISMLSGSLSTK